MKPVEIEFLMRDNLTAGLDKSKMSVEQLLGAARRASLIINTKIEEQRKVIDGVNSDLDRMQRKLQTMKPGASQQELLAEISACKKVLAEETGALQQLEKEHQQARQGVAQLEQEYRKISISEEQAAAANKSLTDKIREQKAVVKQVEADVRALQKAYEQAAPGNAQGAALAELNAAKKALQEDKNILTSLTEEQERNRDSNKRLSRQLRELQNDMARMRLNGEQNTEEYRQMAQKAAQLSDTLGDLRAQTNILANDDANLQGFISGVNGLSGAFTTATGVMSLFASENENLMKVQARVQSVMAITMGLQQVFNALNKDSAFRLVTVTKVKNLLTAANYRLATSLGISNAAATALMATLTLGLSVVITGLIVAWNKYSDAQEEAARKAQERVEIESQGRAEMIKTRFEIDTTRESLKNFTGSKDEEKKKCEEMNRKYGEAFGYYDTVAQWYDVLTQKAEQYINMLFLQAEAQALVNKAAEVDAKLNETHAKDAGEFTGGVWGWLGDKLISVGSAEMNRTPGAPYQDAEAIIRKRREGVKADEEAQLKKQRDDLLAEAKQKVQEAAKIGKSNNIGGHTAPDKPKKTKEKKPKDTKREEERLASELLALQQKNRQAEIDLLKEGSEKKRRQIRENYDKEIAELATQEKKWRDAQKGHLTQEQTDAIKDGRSLAARKQKDGEDEITKEEAKKQQELRKAELRAMNEYLKEYGSYEEKRLAITADYSRKIAEAQNEGERATLDAERKKMLAELDVKAMQESINWEDVFSDMARHSTAYLQGIKEKLRATLDAKDITAENAKILTEKIREIEDTISDRKDIWSSMLPGLRERLRLTEDVARAEEAAAKARNEAIAANLTVLGTKHAIHGKLAEAGVTVNVSDITNENKDRLMANVSKGSDLYDALLKLFENLATDTSKANVAREKAGKAEADKSSVLDKLGSMSKITDIMPGLGSGATVMQMAETVNANVQSLADLTDTIGLGKTEFGEAVHNFADGMGNFTGAMKSLASGDVIGAVNGVIKGFQSFGRLFGIGGGNAESVRKSIERLTERNKLLEQSIRDLTDEMAKSRGAVAIKISIDAEKLQKETNENYKRIAQEKARYHGSSKSFNRYWGGFDKEQINRLSSQIDRQWSGDLWDLSPEEMKKLRSNVDMWEKITNTGEGGYGKRVAEKLNDYIDQAGKLEEITERLYENLTTTTKANVFDDFLGSLHSLADGSEKVFDDIAENWQAMVNRMAVNNLVGAKFQKNLEAWYENLAKLNEARTGGKLPDAEYRKRLDELKAEYEGYVNSARSDIEQLRREGIIKETDRTGGTTQSGRSGAFTTMSQDQATKLEGLFVSGQMHWASIDDRVEDVAGTLNAAQEHLRKIEDNTGSSAESLKAIREEMKKIVRDGIKVK